MSLKHAIIEKLAELMHDGYCSAKLARGGPIIHSVHGRPFDLRKRWLNREGHHQDFDRECARRLLRGFRRMLRVF